MPKIVDHNQRRQELAELAVRVIQRDGPEHATIRKIAKEGGFSIGVLTHYFADKDALVAFTFQWVAAESFKDLEVILRDTAPGLARVRAALEFMVPGPGVQSFMAVWLSLWGGAVHNPVLAKIHRNYYARWRRCLTQQVTEAVRHRHIKAPVLMEDAVALLCAAIDGLWIGANFEPARFPAKRRNQLVGKILKLVLP